MFTTRFGKQWLDISKARKKKPSFKLAFEGRPEAGAKVWQWHDAKDYVIISRHCSSVNRMGLFFWKTSIENLAKKLEVLK
ncbi:MAG: hypothetical protein J1G01_07345 [Clostridiales bacterium]|nr:hypothetical protein [Clostridiales bacterium]